MKNKLIFIALSTIQAMKSVPAKEKKDTFSRKDFFSSIKNPSNEKIQDYKDMIEKNKRFRLQELIGGFFSCYLITKGIKLIIKK